jgi:hypothetical protein
MQDESTYGFSKADASELIQSIGGSEETYREGLVRARGKSLVCITGGSGIAARSGTTVSSATCTIVNRSGSTISTGSSTITVYNLSTTAVGNSVYIVAEPTNIGYVAVWEDC